MASSPKKNLHAVQLSKLKEENINLVQNLNQQYFIYNKILEVIKNKHNNLFFIYDYDGTCKTYLWNAIISKIRSDGELY